MCQRLFHPQPQVLVVYSPWREELQEGCKEFLGCQQVRTPSHRRPWVCAGETFSFHFHLGNEVFGKGVDRLCQCSRMWLQE